MKYLLKGVTTGALLVVGGMIGRNASVGLTNEMALLQMQNVDFVPHLSNTSFYINVAVGLVILFALYAIWRKEIKKIEKNFKTKGEK